jgi:ABC-2 type transport system ATP-binding protein
MLTIEHVNKSYDKKKLALNHVSLSMSPGDLVGFIGHNGAGKTTLLKCIAGILSPDQGTITLNGLQLPKDELAYKRNIAYIPDHPTLYEGLTGFQYIHFIADAFQVPTEIRNTRIKEYALQFDMDQVLVKSIATYSHGMKQKTALIAHLVHEPRLLLLDEPFVGLDPKAAFQLKQVFKTLTQSGAMILFSSHILEVVEKVTNRIAIIQQGKMIRVGPTQEVIKDQSLESYFLELNP